MFDMTIFRLCA